MEAYPRHYVEHNTPLMVVSGLIPSQDDLSLAASPPVGMRISCPLPSLDSPSASILLRCFVASNNTGYWPGKAARVARAAGARGPGPAFRIRIVGREYVFPARKASPPALTVPASPPADNPPARSLHSPLSPLSPESPLYPDGVMTPLWFAKHQDLIPAVFISCFELYTDTTDSNTQAQKDNELIKAINDLKRRFGTSTSTNAIGSGSPAETNARRTRFAVILVAEKSMLHSPDIDERLGIIRRSTGLENNSTLYFLPSPSSPAEIQSFVKNIQFRLFATSLEYYRDLSKHSRRKRKNPTALATVAPTTTSTTMSDVGWGVRYEVKLGVFAEFRQEMDAASRNYETAYEGLISDIFYTTNFWSERWSEARLLADILTIRVIRCLLWLDSWTAAIRRWEYHIEKMRSLVDNKGKGTQTYGFAAWLSTWNRMLAELVQAQNLPIFATTAPQPSNSLIPSAIPNPNLHIYAPPERTIQFADRVSPQDHLHHSGFYYLAAANYAADRQARALKYVDPEPYDDYLCFPPADEVNKVDHFKIQTELFELAKREFLARDQKRMGAMMSHNIARLKMENAEWSEAWTVLKDLAVGYREEGWLCILEEILWRMVECAKRSKDGSKQVIAELELLSSKFGKRPGWRYDLTRCLEGLSKADVKPIVAVELKDVVSFLSASYTFKAASACVGEPAVSQFVIHSDAQEGSAPIVLSSIKITFEGGLKTILLTHDSSINHQAKEGQHVSLVDLKGTLHDPDLGFTAPMSPTAPQSYVTTVTDLSIYPGETKIFELSVVLRETGLAKCMAATFYMATENYELECFAVLEYDGEGWTDELGIGKSVGSGSRRRGCGEITPAGGNAAWWVTDKHGRLRKSPIRNEDPTALTILPKPPKIEVTFNKLDIPAFIDEDFLVRFEVRNEEDEEVEVSLEAKIMGYPEEEPNIRWILPDGTAADPTPSLFPLGRILAEGQLPGQFTFPSTSHPAEVIIEVTVHYHLLSDPETPIVKTTDVDLPIVSPFAVTHDWSPRVHPEKYPNLADLKNEVAPIDPDGKKKPEPKGITQRWCLTAILTNLEAKIDENKRDNEGGVNGTTLIAEGWELEVGGVPPGAECRIVEGPMDGLNIVMNSLKPTEAHFVLDVQRLSFEDRRHFHLDTAIIIKWRRESTAGPYKINTSKFSFPRLPIPGVEPRVLVVARKSKTVPQLPQLTYTIENPTRYPLTFHYSMDDSPVFTFHGPKHDVLPMVPLSRVEIVYQLRPSVKHAWVKPVFKVEDRQFRKVLRCMPAGERGTIGIDKEKRVIVWVDDWEDVVEQPTEEVIDPEDPLGALSM